MEMKRQGLKGGRRIQGAKRFWRMGPSSTIVRYQSSMIEFFLVQFGQISMIRSDLSCEQPAGARTSLVFPMTR
jgi:hypothetical protein